MLSRSAFSVASGILMSSLVLSTSPSLAATRLIPSAAGNSATIVYSANPPRTFAAASLQALPTPSQCIALKGLACYTPSLIRAGYDVRGSATGAGQSIIIVDAYGSPTIRSDCAVFSAAFGLPACKLNVLYPGGKPTFNPIQDHDEAGWASETTLDVEYAHAIAPAATIELVVAANNAGNVLNLAESYAVQNHLGSVMSMSFGAPEGAIAGAGNNLQLEQAHAVYESAKQAGITVVASAGDGGASNGYPFANAMYPASDPDVTSVGGTDLFLSDTGAYQGEYVWDDAVAAQCPFGCRYGTFGATGGAVSAIFAAPAYQSRLSGSTQRTVADVAYDASVYTAVLVYQSVPGTPAGFYFFGGTSSGAPQWAGIIADANQAAGHALGFVNPKLYAIGARPAQYAAAFHDITFGTNALTGPGYNAKVGYDIPSGLGTPDVANLITALLAP
jgi:subtilase family serine protease